MNSHQLKLFWKKYGQYVHQGLFAGGGICASLLYVYPFTGGPKKKFLEERSTYTNGKVDLVDLDILRIPIELKKKLKWNTYMAKNVLGGEIEWFSYNGLDLCKFGYTQLKIGGYIGIPPFYSAKFNKKVEENPDFLMKKFNIDIRTDEGEKLYKLLQLSDDAKRFSLGKMMIQVKSIVPFITIFTMPVVSYGCCVLSMTLAQFIPIRGAVLGCYAILIPLSILSVYKLFDFLNTWGEKRAIKRIAKLDEHLAKGGLEYYESLIEREKLQEPELIKGISFEEEGRYRDLIIKQSMNRIITFLNSSNVKNLFLGYRKPQLSNEEKKKVVEDVIAMKYSKVEDQEKLLD